MIVGGIKADADLKIRFVNSVVSIAVRNATSQVAEVQQTNALSDLLQSAPK